MPNREQTIRALLKDPENFVRFAGRISKTVLGSFDHDLIIRPQITQAEIRERTLKSYDLFIMMRTELHYSTQKALDVLPTALRAELDGTPWKPSKPDRGWAAGRISA